MSMEIEITREDYTTSRKLIENWKEDLGGSYSCRCIVACAISRTMGFNVRVGGYVTVVNSNEVATNETYSIIGNEVAVNDLMHSFDQQNDYSKEEETILAVLPIKFTLRRRS